MKCLLWADVDLSVCDRWDGKWTGASAHSIDVVHCSRMGDRATLKTTDIVQKKKNEHCVLLQVQDLFGGE